MKQNKKKRKLEPIQISRDTWCYLNPKSIDIYIQYNGKTVGDRIKSKALKEIIEFYQI